MSQSNDMITNGHCRYNGRKDALIMHAIASSAQAYYKDLSLLVDTVVGLPVCTVMSHSKLLIFFEAIFGSVQNDGSVQ